MDVWTTKSGEEILIREMTDGHLLNAIMMIERNYRRICGTEPVDLVKETKRALTTGDFEEYIRTPIWKNYAALHNEAYASLLDEATRRGLHCGSRESTR
jgi:hypothetical protein